MEYNIFVWDMYRSTEAVRENSEKTIEFLGKIAGFALELTSELPDVTVVGLGDGQMITVSTSSPNTDTLPRIADDIVRYADSLSRAFPDYQIRGVLSTGELAETPIGLIGKVLWDINSEMEQVEPGTIYPPLS